MDATQTSQNGKKVLAIARGGRRIKGVHQVQTGQLTMGGGVECFSLKCDFNSF